MDEPPFPLSQHLNFSMRIGIDTAPILQHQFRGVGALGAHLLEFLLNANTKNTFCLFEPTRPVDANIFSENSEKEDGNEPRKFPDYLNSKNIVCIPRPFVSAGFSLGRLQDAWRLDRQIREVRPDVFHAYFQWNLPLLDLPVPVIGHVYDLMPIAVRDIYLRRYRLRVRGKIRLYEQYLKFSLRKTNRVFTISEHTKKDLINLTGYPEERVHVVYPAPASSMKRPDQAGETLLAREKFGLEEDYLLYVGGYDYRKNLEMLLGAYSQARKKGLDLPLVLAGDMDSPYGQLIHRMVIEAGPNNGVRIIGHVPDRDLPGLYAGARIFLYPSLYEGFGLPVIDAMACGAPVVSSNAISLPEAGGDAAILLNPEDETAWSDSILQLAGDEGTRDEIRDRGFLQVAGFSWKKAAKETLRVYEEIVGESG